MRKWKILRVQPPKDMDSFVGKTITPEMVIDYIGSHQVFFSSGKKATIQELVDKGNYFYKEHVDCFYMLFPSDLKELADAYIVYMIQENKI